jgi:HlyD family secretion protein
VISSGQLRVESQRQVVQHPDGGVVSEILVREGTLVKAGAVLIRLDGTTLLSELAVMESQLFELMARRGRLVAEQTDQDSIIFDAELLEVATNNAAVKNLIDGQQALFEARLRTMEREIEVMRERQVQIDEQITGSAAETEALQRQSELIEQELVGQRKLLKQGLAQASRVLSLEREAARLDGQRGQMIAQTAQLKGQISELEIELLRLGATRREDAITTLRDLGFRELELKERRIALKEQLSRLDVRAPLGGVVLDMSVYALQSVVRAAEPILYIVPSDSALVVDAQVDPIHIDSVRVGQEAVLNFSAFNTRTTPQLFGTVSKVSPDAFIDEQTKRSYYRAEVLLKAGELPKLEGQELVAGMPVEVFIQTGERTPLNYMLKPITDYFNRAMREE